VIAHAGKPVAPDANSTLRVSIAHIKGYAPRDGVLYTPQTTLAGMLEKHTGEDSFDVPRLDATSKTRLEQVPLDFLADADTTGGNSGRAAINGRGELVGLSDSSSGSCATWSTPTPFCANWECSSATRISGRAPGRCATRASRG
jgi:hypothetical protein